jgi:hypothetical protein
MTITTEELVGAREAANAILEELAVDAYLFEVEPKDEHYELKVDCACEIDGGWASITLNIPKEKMLTGFDDLKLKRQLFEYWDKKLSACKRRKAREGI